MVRILVENIVEFAMSDTGNEVTIKRGESKRILKALEKKYNLKSCFVCRKIGETYILYESVRFSDIPNKDKKMWIDHYEAYVKSSLKYKWWRNFIMDLFLD